MEKIRLLAIGLLILLVAGCTEKIFESAFPDKLSPYETYYDPTVFEQRREALMNDLPDDAMALIVTNDTYLRNGDVDFDFRPASAFYYLTGFDEPNAAAVIRKNAANPNTTEFIMFVEERSPGMEQWMGSAYGPDDAVEHFGADSAYGIDHFGPKMTAYLNSGNYSSVYANLEANPTLSDIFYDAAGDTTDVLEVEPFVDALRVIKSPDEIDLIQKAVDVTVQAFTEAMQVIEPGMYEY